MEWNGSKEMEERRCIADTGKTLRKYGSTAKHMMRAESLIKHIVVSTDTLQGIALKYGVTTEQIRRVNRLWASDSLFLREYLLIPVSTDSPLASSVECAVYNDSECNSTQNVSSPSVISPLDDESSADDFLAKMDTCIANVKKDIKRAQGSSEFCNEGNDTYVQQRRTSNKFKDSLPSNTHISAHSSELRLSSSSDMQNFPTAVVMTQGRKVKTSLQRLQQQQDEMFQL
ncbi:lysM and putative peptidoglycan-binding domain-containing protein 2-like [Vespa mandarinia]|uniref:lysM and putative peptidoglycan-binding domain-containing protein 2-like n=1 Tax=Vespa mandarinia TaxID=7446 RepID=UPI00161A8EE9|nr:lysM and putative peptidoglycan-binding domain-containing protein 2-like [Vespa mandarinia]